MLCENCEKRLVCQSACPELELHLKEIEKPQREKTVGLPNYSARAAWPSGVELTKQEKKIGTLLAAGVDRGMICEQLNITRKTLRNIIHELRKKWDDLHHY
jgi:DNA-binding NarL/FixJ family response regulator